MLRRILASPRSRSDCRAYLAILFLVAGLCAVVYGFAAGGELTPSVAVARPLDFNYYDSSRGMTVEAASGMRPAAETMPVLGAGQAAGAYGAAGTNQAVDTQADIKPPAVKTILPTEPATAEPVVFRSSHGPIDDGLKQELLKTGVLRADGPVPVTNLHILTVTYWDFEGKAQTGRLIVNEMWAPQICSVFKTLFEAHFPIRRMDPLHFNVVRGNDAATSDNTAGFQTRRVNGGWSMHAYGLAVDINPAENPWVRGGSTVPEVGAAFKDRITYSTGMVQANSVVVKAFAAIGWKWGGNWASSKDYMHFSSNGH